MRQLGFFDYTEAAPDIRDRLNGKSEQLIAQFAAQRRREGASPRSVLREASQLRSIARDCGDPARPLPLATIFADMSLIAQALREPATPISRSTGRARLIAAQRFLRIVGPDLGRDAAEDLQTLDGLLPAHPASSWHTQGILVAGETNRRRRRGPTLDTADLWRIVEAAGAGSSGERSLRDRALVAVQCFSGLRVEEVVALRWTNIGTHLTSVGYYGLAASVERRGHQVQLPLPGPSGEALDQLRDFLSQPSGSVSGPVFRVSTRSDRPLSYRGARKVLVAACRRAGLPPAASSELRAGCAYWLRGQGLSDHEVAVVLGLARVRTVDRLLRGHAALSAQRQVREHLEA